MRIRLAVGSHASAGAGKLIMPTSRGLTLLNFLIGAAQLVIVQN
jgi:hypothetical protein